MEASQSSNPEGIGEVVGPIPGADNPSGSVEAQASTHSKCSRCHKDKNHEPDASLFKQCESCRVRMRGYYHKAARKNRLEAAENVERQVQEGLCLKCGIQAPDEPGSDMCEGCKQKRDKVNDKKREIIRGIRRRRIEAGLCYQCGKVPGDGNKARCAGCARDNNVKEREKRRVRKEAGLCWYCGVAPTHGASDRCIDCRQEGARASKEYIGRRKAAGLCIQCGRCPPDGATVMCVGCKQDQAGRKREVTRQKMEAKLEGLTAEILADLDRMLATYSS